MPEKIPEKIYRKIDVTASLETASLKNKDIVVILGPDKVGKSILLNLLLGHDLRKIKCDYDVVENKNFIIDAYQQSNKPSNVPVNDTVYLVELQLDSIKAKDIVNITANAKSVKFLYVENYELLNCLRGKAFREVFDKFFKLFPDPEQLQGASLFVVTKSDTRKSTVLIEKNIQNKVPKEFYQIFPEASLEDIMIPFLKSSYFVDEVGDMFNKESEDVFHEEKMKRYIKQFRKDIRKKIDGLTPYQGK